MLDKNQQLCNHADASIRHFTQINISNEMKTEFTQNFI